MDEDRESAAAPSEAVQSPAKGRGRGAATGSSAAWGAPGSCGVGLAPATVGCGCGPPWSREMGVFSHAGHRELTFVMVYLAADKVTDITGIDKRSCFIGSCFSRVTEEI